MAKAKKLEGTAPRGTVTINAPSNNWLEKESPTRVIDLDEESTTETKALSTLEQDTYISEASAPANGNDLLPDEPENSDVQNNAGEEAESVEGKNYKPSARAKNNNRNRVKAKKHAKHKATAKALATSKPAKQPKLKAMPGDAEAKEINQEHDALTAEFAEFAAQEVPKAVMIGEKLQKIKKAVGHGHFEKWVEKHLTFDVRTARRYMARAKTNRTNLSDLKQCAAIMNEHASDGFAPKETAARTVPFKVFTPAATKVLNQPVETMSPDHKITILGDYERLEPIAMQLQEHPSIFALSWQKKLQQPPVRWARKDIALFKAEIAKAQAILTELEKDATFDAAPEAPAAQVAEANVNGDAP